MNAADYEHTEELFDAGVKLRPGRFGVGIAIAAVSLYVVVPEKGTCGVAG